MLAAPQLTIRPATEADRGLCAEWWRGLIGAPEEEVLPAIGVVCEDEQGPCGIVFLYLNAMLDEDAPAPGVGFVEWLCMKPGLQLSESVQVGKALMDGIAAAAKELGYGLLIAYSLKPCARYLKSFGWKVGDPREKIAMFLPL